MQLEIAMPEMDGQGHVRALLNYADRARRLIEFMAMLDCPSVTATQLEELACQARDWLRYGENMPSRIGRETIGRETAN